ncbi:malto-oligosyltrehalose trehalohydrolase [soil metagenome]
MPKTPIPSETATQAPQPVFDSQTSPRFGAVPRAGAVRFRVWAPGAHELRLTIETGQAAGTRLMPRDDKGVHDLIVEGAAAGDRYHYRLDGGGPRPDPASRFQPEGVHGLSEVVDPFSFSWRDTRWRGRSETDLVIYEMHVGTFSPEGTFEGARRRLRDLRDLGVTAIELMPVADFPGDRNWGYDGVCLFAPARTYGRPDDLRRLVDDAHGLGLSVLLDVVYNHLGPEGAYLPQFNPEYMTDRHETPWGRAINFDGPGSPMVRRFIIENALHWVHEYHVDGLRLDATHAIIDDSPVHVLVELATTVRASADRPILIHAEDHRNLAAIVEGPEAGGWGLDGVWADDFHHVLRRMLAGDSHGYYADFDGTTSELARTINQGWLFTGQPSKNMGEHRGTDPSHLPMFRSVVCIQNHDQVGNRAGGDRLHHAMPAASWRAASTLLLTCPMTPLLFMGQEWAASAPFQYFTDLEPELGRLVTAGRRREFASFPEFSDPLVRERIPDPQAPTTFENSRLDWEERGTDGHAGVLALYTRLLSLRLEYPALGGSVETRGHAVAVDPDTIILVRSDGGARFWVVVRLRGAGTADVGAAVGGRLGREGWEILVTTEEPMFVRDPALPDVAWQLEGPVVRFERPGAVILTQR